MSDDVQILNEVSEVDVNSLGVRGRGQRRRVSTVISGPSLTKQADREGACIHKILDKYKRTGLLPQCTIAPLEGELPNVESFHDAMNKIVAARQAFDGMPSELRERFKNDPSRFLEFVGDEKNADEMIKLGLARKTASQAAGGPSQEASNTAPVGGAAERAQNAGVAAPPAHPQGA